MWRTLTTEERSRTPRAHFSLSGFVFPALESRPSFLLRLLEFVSSVRGSFPQLRGSCPEVRGPFPDVGDCSPEVRDSFP